MLEEIKQARELDRKKPAVPPHFDQHRRSKIAAVEKLTGRPLIIYASACTTAAKNYSGDMLMLDFSDKIGFKTVTEKVDPPNLDVLIHSPGGFPAATESLVQQLRNKYSSVRFIVPSFAKSAATMMVMSGDEILMATDAELGPIDPQFVTANGVSPAEAILEQFKKAQAELQADASKLPSWMPILAPLGPSLLVDCAHAIDLGKTLVGDWLRTYMFAGDADRSAKADAICNFLSSHVNFKSHSRAVKFSELVNLSVKVVDLAKQADLALAVDELYCCMDILFTNGNVYKIFENSKGDALIRQQQQFMVPAAFPTQQ